MRIAIPLLLLLPVALAAAAWSAAQNQPAAATDEPTIPRGPFSEEQIAGIKQTMLDRVNEDRYAEGLDPVEFDDLAGEVADRYAAAALENDTIGHYTLDGISPFGRWGLAGGVDFVAENACAWYWTGPDKDWSEGELLDILQDFEDAMIGERPPGDGHRRTILNPCHTHVGMGLAITGTRVRYMQEFVSRHVELDAELPAEVGRDESVTVSGRVIDPERYRTDFVLVYYEKPPKAISAEECARRNVYGFPDQKMLLRPTLPDGQYYLPDRGRGEFDLNDSKTVFRAKIPWFKGPGWYYVVVLLAPRDAAPGTEQFPATFPLIRVGESGARK